MDSIDSIIQTILSPLIAFFDLIVSAFHSIGLSWGLAIIALTILVRLVLLPLAIKQYRSMKALTDLAPQIKELNDKYKDDKEKLQQETIKFYAENKVNPFASCLPLLFQIPVFVSLFYMLRIDLKIDICGPESKIIAVGKEARPPTDIANTYCNAVDPGSAQFLFIPDLTAPALGSVLIILLALYVFSQLLSSVLMSANSDWRSRAFVFVLPFFFILFIKGFPTGLLVYWITTNFWTVGQQYFLLRGSGQLPQWLGGDKIVEEERKVEENKKIKTKKPPPPPRKKKRR